MKHITSKLTRTSILVSTITIATTIATTALARPDDSEGGKRGKRGAPPEAIEACVDKTVDEFCEFTGRRGSVSGTCFLPSEDSSELACKPEGHDERQRS